MRSRDAPNCELQKIKMNQVMGLQDSLHEIHHNTTEDNNLRLAVWSLDVVTIRWNKINLWTFYPQNIRIILEEESRTLGTCGSVRRSRRKANSWFILRMNAWNQMEFIIPSRRNAQRSAIFSHAYSRLSGLSIPCCPKSSLLPAIRPFDWLNSLIFTWYLLRHCPSGGW